MFLSEFKNSFSSWFFQSVLEVQEGVWFLNMDGKTLYANPALTKLLGYSENEMRGRAWFSFVSTFLDADALILRKKDGSLLEVRAAPYDLIDEKDVVVGTRIHIRQNEKVDSLNLNSGHEFLDSLIDHLPLVVYVKSAEDHRFVRVNRFGLDLLGLKNEDVIGKSDYDFFSKEEADRMVCKDLEALNGNIVVDVPEEVILTGSREVRILHTRKIPWYGPDKKPKYLFGIAEDITERKKAEEDNLARILLEAAEREKAESLSRLRFLSDISAAVNSLDHHAAFEGLSTVLVPRFCDNCAVRIDPDETLSDQSVVLASKQSEFFQSNEGVGLTIAIRGRKRLRGRLFLWRQDPSALFSTEDCILAEEIGSRVGLAMENALLYESAQKALEARDVFLSVASHELKTPITSLKMNLQLADRKLRETELDEQAGILMKRTDQQINRLVLLIENLLDVSRIRLGKLELQCESVNFSEMIRTVASDHREALSSAGCFLELDLQESLSGFVDRGRVEQILINLFSNIIKYAPGTKVNIQLSKEDDYAALTVRDHGPGIPLEQRARLFERFSRVDSSRNISGLGLGLFISREIAEHHGGSLFMVEPVGEGAAFRLRLPLASSTSV